MQKAWTDDAWADYLYWQTQDKKTLKRINNLVKDIDRHPFSGIGKAEEHPNNGEPNIDGREVFVHLRGYLK